MARRMLPSSGMASIGSTSASAMKRRHTPLSVQARARGETDVRDVELHRVRTLARTLDRYYLDPILGFVVPGAGDVVGSLLGFYAVVIAWRRKVSKIIIARMLLNLAVDAVFGFIPLLGDLFDARFKANLRNVELLTARVDAGGKATARDWAIVIGALLAYLTVLVLLVWGMIALVRRIF
jgi:hypothetical protein